jgi:hypothetical protein
MAMSPEHRAKMLHSTRTAAIALIEDLAHLREMIARDDPSPAEIRRAANVLRRLLIDGAGDIRLVAAPRTGKVLIKTLDNKPYYRAAERGQLAFFLSGYCDAFNLSMRGYYLAKGDTDPVEEADPETTVSLPIDSFLNQRVVHFNGAWASRKNVIQYAAHIASGVHSGTPKEPDELLLAAADAVVRFVRDTDGLASIQGNFAFAGQPWRPLPYAPGALTATHFELLATAKLLCASPDIIRLEADITVEISA